MNMRQPLESGRIDGMSRRFQFSLRAMFKGTTFVATLCAVCALAGGPVATGKGLESAFYYFREFNPFIEVALSVAIYITPLLIVWAVYIRNTKADAQQPESPFNNH